MLYAHMCMYCIVCICVCAIVLTWRLEDNFWKSLFPPLTMWIPVLEIRFLSVLVASALPAELSCWPSSVSKGSAKPYTGLGEPCERRDGAHPPQHVFPHPLLTPTGEASALQPPCHASRFTLHQALKVNNKILLACQKAPLLFYISEV